MLEWYVELPSLHGRDVKQQARGPSGRVICGRWWSVYPKALPGRGG